MLFTQWSNLRLNFSLWDYPAQKVSILSSKFLHLEGLVLLEYLPAQKNTVHPVKQDWGLLLTLCRTLWELYFR